MNDATQTNSPVDSSGGDDVSDKELKKQLRLEREKKELLASLASGDFSTTKARVAAMLNLYPQTRNSDVALALKYWETFQPDVYSTQGILPKDLFKLERFHYLVRARAKIQNQYGLFDADDKIRRHRKLREEEMHEAVLDDGASRRLVQIFADETGKTNDFVSVAAVWVLAGRAVFSITRAIQTWKEKSVWAKREIHFSKFGKADLEPLAEYLDVIQANREYMSFKVITVERAKTRRDIEEIVRKLHEHMLVRGMEHEVSSGRIDLPREIEVTLDQELSLDQFTLAEMKRRIADEFCRDYQANVTLHSIQTVSSRHSPMVQLADLIAGAINRRLNFQGERNHKDEMSDLVIDKLGLSLTEEPMPELDSSALFVV